MGKYKKKGTRQKEWTDEEVRGAMNALNTGRSVASISRDLGIPNQTLHRWKSQHGIVTGTGRACVLYPFEEELILTALETAADCGFPLTRQALKTMVASYC